MQSGICRIIMREEGLFDGKPDGFALVLGLDDLLLEAMNPDAAVNQLTYKLVLANEYAAFGVF